MMLKDKKILFISASFFNYEKAIISKMKELGASVDFFDERPSNTALTKGLIRINPKFLEQKTNAYYQKIWAQIQSKTYDYFLLIKGETIPFWFLEQFKSEQGQCKTIFYAYDAIVEYPKTEKLFPYFDLNFSFEPNDARKFGLHFRPLFHLDEYKKETTSQDYDYAVSFVGSAHSDRYQIGEAVKKIMDDQKRKSYFFYYAPSKKVFLAKRLLDSNLKKFDLNKLSFNKLSHAEIQSIYQRSFSVLDINKPFQMGLTMRSFEALASGKKLITTNVDIVHYPFYSPENIQVIHRENIQINPAFFEAPFVPITNELLAKLSLESWLEALFIKEQDEFWFQNFMP